MASRRRYNCTEPGCDKSFYRSEHLSRHRLNHRPKEVFQCQHCPKKFVRRDLVQRHEKRHEKGMWFRNSGGVINESAEGVNGQPIMNQTDSASGTDQGPSGISPQEFDQTHPCLEATNGGDDTRQESENADLMLSEAQQTIIPHTSPCQMLSQPIMRTPGMPENIPVDGGSNPLFFDSSMDIIGQSNDIDWFFEGVPLELSPLQTVDFNGPSTSHPSSIFIPPTSPYGTIQPMLPLPTSASSPVLVSHISANTTWSTVSSRIRAALYTLPSDVLDAPFFYPENLASFFDLYFANYHPHFPIFHKPTLFPAEAPPLMVTAIVSLGATLASDEDHFRVATRIHDALRWLVFGTGAFEPPAPLWCLQTLLILQAHEKMFSTRKHHEMAHIFHGSIITLMRRGTAYSAESIPQDQPGTELEQTWHRWVTNEASKRTAFFAFVMDAQHTFLFGHTCVLSAHDVQLSLPCPEVLWEQQSPEAWAQLSQDTPESPRFLPTLKGLLAKIPVPSNCSSFSRLILLHGLFSVTAHLQARDLATLGVGRPSIDDNSSSAIDIWKDILERAIDTWSFSLLSRESSLSLEAAKPLHRMAHVAIYTNIIDFHILAGAPPLLGSPLSPHDYIKAQSRVRAWSKLPDAKKALYYCLLLIKETVFTGRRYVAAEENIVVRPWCLYHATLIAWAYGQMMEEANNHNVDPAFASTHAPSNPSAQQHGSQTIPWTPGSGTGTATTASDAGGNMAAEEYLVRMLMLLKANTQEPLEGANQTQGLILSVRESLEGCRWELLQEAYTTLGRLVGIPGPSGIEGVTGE
ncbi:zf-C2H2 Zinc finger, C2H2 type [Myotisia sp. PD_48]|nr:zf-C2H2 Zinc finger, C2H2 type [Myotisia sp. PD_48]